MKRGFTSRQLERSGWSNVVFADGSPLPRQGEEEGEGLSEAIRAYSESPHLGPLPFSEGRGEKKYVELRANLRGQNVTESARPEDSQFRSNSSE